MAQAAPRHHFEAFGVSPEVYLAVLATEADRFEFLLTGRDEH